MDRQPREGTLARWMRRIHAVAQALIVAVALLAAAARADGPVLHEYVPNMREGELIEPPGRGALQSDERPMVAADGDSAGAELPGRRSPTFRPDFVTSLEGTLAYYEVFSPAIAPFKRVTALDAVVLDSDGRTPVLVTRTRATTHVEVEGVDAPPPDRRPRDRFWGSVVLDFAGGRTVPLPSVSPESRILTLRTEPEALLRIEKDGADNFRATAVGRLPERRVRVVFLTDAPRSYFGAELPSTPSDALSGELGPPPAHVGRQAVTLARDLGLHRGMPVRDALAGLVGYFRDFEESSVPPRDTGNIYLDLARGRRGVCRHRAYAFVITAQALGIPARFVQNETHAWAEVKLPEIGWMRIDLGGAAQGLAANNLRDRPMYGPERPDPLPRPARYEQSYSLLRGRVGGMPVRRAGASATLPASAPGPMSSGEAMPPGGDGRRPLVVTVDQPGYEVFRGHDLEVTGRVTGDGRGIAGLRMEVLVGGGREQLLGVTVTGEDGRYRGVYGVPPDLAVGDYRLLVRTPGDQRWLPAAAR